MKWLLLAIFAPLVSAQYPFWIDDSVKYHGFLIRGWNFTRCASEHNYPVNITNIVISPDKPQFPGPIFFHITIDVKEDLPHDNINLDLEVRAPFQSRELGKGWKIIPCEGWNIEDGCDGHGSCRYCNILETCNKTVIGAFKYVKVQKIFRNTKDSECPPPKGQLTMTFSKNFSIEEVRHSFLGYHFTSEYFLTFNFNGEQYKKLGCARLWIDVCRYHLNDKDQECLKKRRTHSIGFFDYNPHNLVDWQTTWLNSF